MSVYKSKRNESKFEPLSYSLELYVIFQDLVARNLGIKDLDTLIKRKYQYGKAVKEDFPYYRNEMYKFKKRIKNGMLKLTDDLRAANTIYITTLSEYDKRRNYLDDAIVDCELIKKDLILFVEVFDIDLNIYKSYVDAIEREITLIKKWRQRDNVIKNNLLKKELPINQ